MTDLFSDLLKRRTVTPGEIIFLDGQDADSAYVILKGEVQAGSHSPSGAFIVLSRMHAGEMFGEIALLRPDGKRTAATMSEEGCELLVIPRAVFDARLTKADPLLHFIISHLCRRIVGLTERVVSADLAEPGPKPS